MSDDLDIGPTALEPGPRGTRHTGDHLARTILVPLVGALVLIVLVFYVFFSGAVVQGLSMWPTLSNGDYLLITHGDRSPRRGDIVLTRVIESSGPVEVVKRVIALPGDTVEIRDDVAYVNGRPEPARGQIVVPRFSVSRPPLTVPAGRVYVMGDNRPVSEDSRNYGPVAESGIKGRALLVFAPIDRIKLVR